ncbi:hypothetical protein N9M23_04250 [Gammaproteobacteria bacterium]|jgi:hypothetical protein|nr:hypothetical protein [Gammaproteobacteria bacterium]
MKLGFLLSILPFSARSSRGSRAVSVAGMLLLSACAAEPGGYVRKLPTDAEVAQYNASVTPDERIVCRLETPLGTNVPRRLCRYIRDIEATSRFHREQLTRVLR